MKKLNVRGNGLCDDGKCIAVVSMNRADTVKCRSLRLILILCHKTYASYVNRRFFQDMHLCVIFIYFPPLPLSL